jgi:outer membrane protein assembly factor BamE (lipoprotein component of BamABCDE complex)
MRAAWIFGVCLFMASTLACCCPKMDGDNRDGNPPQNRPAEPEKKIYTRNEFRNLVVGKTGDEVLRAVGKPESTQDMGSGQYWYYREMTKDPVTDKIDASAQVIFEGGRAVRVNY